MKKIGLQQHIFKYSSIKLLPQGVEGAKLNYSIIENKRNQVKDQQINLIKNNIFEDNLIVFHGYMGSSSNFRSICRNSSISSLVTSYLLDIRNHGFSEHRNTMTIPELSQDLAHFIQSKNLKNLFLMGHSLGGRIIMNFLSEYPQAHEIIKGVVIADILPDNYQTLDLSNYDQNMIRVKKLLDIKIQDYLSLQKLRSDIQASIGNQMVSDLFLTNIVENEDSEQETKGKFRWRFNLQVLHDSYINLLSPEIKPGNFKGKFKIICGENSEYVKKHQIQSYKNIFPNIDFDKDIYWMKNCGHWLHYQNPAEFIKTVSDFIKNCQQSVK